MQYNFQSPGRFTVFLVLGGNALGQLFQGSKLRRSRLAERLTGRLAGRLAEMLSKTPTRIHLEPQRQTL